MNSHSKPDSLGFIARDEVNIPGYALMKPCPEPEIEIPTLGTTLFMIIDNYTMKFSL
jgi:hypothetical protein